MPDPQTLADGKLRLDYPAEHVARITLTKSEKKNALDHLMLDTIAEVVPTIDARCLIVTGEGGIFSAGYDIGSFPPETFAQEAERLVAHPFHSAVEALENFPFPTLAVLPGHAIGGGLELALACDLRIASLEAKVGMPPGKLGLVYSHTGIKKFLDAAGSTRTRELFFTARNISAPRAFAWGLINEIYSAEEIEAEGLRWATEVAANAPISLSGNKKVIGALLDAGHELDPELEAELIELRKSCFATEDFHEGVTAFAERRPPVWKGR